MSLILTLIVMMFLVITALLNVMRIDSSNLQIENKIFIFINQNKFS